MTINPMQIMQQLRMINDPSAFAMNLLEQNSVNNPFVQNIMNLAKNNQTQEIENIARNTFKEQGRDFDEEFSMFKKMMGMK